MMYSTGRQYAGACGNYCVPVHDPVTTVNEPGPCTNIVDSGKGVPVLLASTAVPNFLFAHRYELFLAIACFCVLERARTCSHVLERSFEPAVHHLL